MKRSPTGIFVIALLTLITINHIYKPSIQKYANADTMVEGFGVLNGTLTDANDVSYTEINSITLDINEVVQRDDETNYDYLKAQILNTVRMFNAKLELYIKTYIDNPEISDPTILNRKNTINKHAITFLISILPQLFGNLNELASDYIYGFASSYSVIPIFNGIIKQDNTVTPEILKTIRMYFNRMNSYIQVVLYQLLQKTDSDSLYKLDQLTDTNEPSVIHDSLYTLNQLTNTENTSEPSIIHFLIKTDDESELVKFLNQLSNGMTPEIIALDFYISNSINYVVNDNFTLVIKINLLTPDYKSTYELRKITNTNPNNTIDKHIEDMQYETKKKTKQLTEGDVLSGLNPSSAYTSLIGKIMVCIILGMVALVLGIYYYIMSQGSASSENPRKITSDMMTYMNLPNMASGIKNAISGIKMPKLPEMTKLSGMPNIPDMTYLSNNPITVVMAILLFVFMILYMTLGGKDKNSDYLSWGNVDIKAKTKEFTSSKELSKTYSEYSDVINENTKQKKEKMLLDKNQDLYNTVFDE